MNCSATTKAGKPCSAHPVHGTSLCLAHSPGMQERARKANAASAEARKRLREERGKALEEDKRTLTQRIAAVAARRADEFSEALVQRAIDEPNSQAAAMVLDRVEGRLVDRVETVPSSYSVDDMMRDLAALPETNA
jgi:hypothetical protein